MGHKTTTDTNLGEGRVGSRGNVNIGWEGDKRGCGRVVRMHYMHYKTGRNEERRKDVSTGHKQS